MVFQHSVPRYRSHTVLSSQFTPRGPREFQHLFCVLQGCRTESPRKEGQHLLLVKLQPITCRVSISPRLPSSVLVYTSCFSFHSRSALVRNMQSVPSGTTEHPSGCCNLGKGEERELSEKLVFMETIWSRRASACEDSSMAAWPACVAIWRALKGGHFPRAQALARVSSLRPSTRDGQLRLRTRDICLLCSRSPSCSILDLGMRGGPCCAWLTKKVAP